MVELSIIIVSFNTKQMLIDCLRSVYSQTSTVRFEVIIVDNHSRDGSAEAVRTMYPEVIVIENEENRGFAGANNQALRHARGEFLLLLNSDTVILDDAIGKTLQFMIANGDASIAGCRHIYPDGRLQPSCRSFPTLWNIFTEATFLYIPFKRTKLFGGYYLTYLDYRALNRVDVVMGSFMLIRRSVIETIGLLDEQFYFYTEETDYCYRAKQRGLKTYYYPDAVIIHYGGASSDNSMWKFFNLHLTQFKFLDKHYSGWYRRAARGMKRMGILLRIPVYFLAGITTFQKEFLVKCSIHMTLAFQRFR